MSSRSWILGAATTLVVAVGLIVWPLFSGDGASPLAPEFGAESPDYALLAVTATAIEAACQSSDYASFQQHVTTRYRRELAAELALLGRDLQRDFGELGSGLLGDSRAAQLLVGKSRNERAVLVYRQATAGRVVDELAVVHLRATIFIWNGNEFELDGQLYQRLPTPGFPLEAARAWADEVLAGTVR